MDLFRLNGLIFVGLLGEFYFVLSFYGINVKLIVYIGEFYDEWFG